MYLKSIEMQGFKSFANKIVLDFHNGITGIVGPNGSGKSNVADAVRWVLGEQSAKQLRGSSMQDIIFAGTENRRPLGFAYVAITMDNSDHALPVDYKEVTVSRRVYRSGESEYMINQSPCRLRDVQELFYDTGVGKEGYSIIGQGQIDRILSGKPEERRELFDEAVGIVKYKKRKETAEKKLENEHDNLLRVNDILKELEDRVEPLEKQSETARNYLRLKEELKKLDVNYYLNEVTRIEKEKETTQSSAEIIQHDLEERKDSLEKIKKEHGDLEEMLNAAGEKIEAFRLEENEILEEKSKLLNQISILEEQIRSADTTGADIEERRSVLLQEQEEKKKQREQSLSEKKGNHTELENIRIRLKAASDSKNVYDTKIQNINDTVSKDQEELVELLKSTASIKSEEQKFNTMREQVNIKKAALVQRMIEKKGKEESFKAAKDEKENSLKEANEEYLKILANEKIAAKKAEEWEEKRKNLSISLDEKKSRLETVRASFNALSSMAERYEGFGGSIKSVMENKNSEPGLIGVVSDLISVEKKYETAIETALGGNIQNVVTEDEGTAKRMINYLKDNRLGRATFLPLTNVHPKDDRFSGDELNEKGVIGVASDIVECDNKYSDVMKYLLGRVLVMEDMDSALRFSKKNGHKEHIVTLDGEYLRPGGSISGGKFKDKNNLLGRTRRLDKLKSEMKELTASLDEIKEKFDSAVTAAALNKDELDELRDKSREAAVLLNTAKMEFDLAVKNLDEHQKKTLSLDDEKKNIEKELKEIESGKENVAEKIAAYEARQEELNSEINSLREELDSTRGDEPELSGQLSAIRIEESNAIQKMAFIDENIERLEDEIQKNQEAIEKLVLVSDNAKDEILKKKTEIEDTKKKIQELEDKKTSLEEQRKKSIEEKEKINNEYKGFFDKSSEVTENINSLDKELYKLKARFQRLEEELDYQNNYMWEEYELTRHSALNLKDDEIMASGNIKKNITTLKDEIRSMGNVNVNAIEEYKEVSERYEFLKTQHDDLITAEESLKKIIDDLDSGMREQFKEGFKDIQREFDKSFKSLFGGGKGTLELVEGEDLLETGIVIIAQPPGKKLINMMQMSGGEKALTAIALLFAIQQLKPSPFCLLDEIEAALDDSNVDRFAQYLKKLTKNTQFIIITHRRGTMNEADRLYGITMQEKGVSVLVSVNLIENQLDS
jgi:chromosome segregation protein